MDDRELNPILREAYRQAPETAEPSEWLWRRTRRALRARSLLARPSRKTLFARVAAAAALAGFLAGWVAGRTTAREAPSGAPVTAPEVAEALERVQHEGTDYARALEALNASLERASGAEVATGQQVLIALAGAHAELVRGMAPAHSGTIEDLPMAPAASRVGKGPGHGPLIWF